MKICVFISACVAAAGAFCGIVSEVAVPSESMGKNIPASVILPDGYDADSTNRWPVVYVLHGAGGSHRKYIDVGMGLDNLADRFQVIIACADGANTSWWFDSPIDPSYRLSTIGSSMGKAVLFALFRTWR